MIFAIFNLSTVAALWFGAIRVQDGALSIGNLTAFLQYLTQILFAILTAVFMFILVPRAAVSSGRIREVLDTEPSIHDPERRRSCRIRRRRTAASSSSATSSSATRAPSSRSSTTSRSGPSPARRPRSSAAPAAASRPSST